MLISLQIFMTLSMQLSVVTVNNHTKGSLHNTQWDFTEFIIE